MSLAFSQQQGFTHITDWNSAFGGNVTAEGFYEYDGTYVIPIYKVNWSGDLEGTGISPTVKVSNLNYAIQLSYQNITDFPTDISFFNNDVGYLTTANLPVYENLSQFINDVGYALQSDLTWNNITGKPDVISYWNNDIGYITMLNLTELKQQVQDLNISLQGEALARNQTDTMLLQIIQLLDQDIQDEITARIEADSNLSQRLIDLNMTLSNEISTLYMGISGLNSTKSGIGTCPSGYAVQNLTTGSPDCVQIYFPETDPIFTAENQTIWTAIWDRMLITDQRYNETGLIYQIQNDFYFVVGQLNSTIMQEIQDRLNADNILIGQIDYLNQTKSGLGGCPMGFVIQNLTSTTPECVALLDLESDPVFLANNQSIWDAITTKLDIFDQRYNDTALIYQIEDNIILQINDLTLLIQNVNASLQQEILDRMDADNLMYAQLETLNLTSQQEILDRMDAINSLNSTKSGIGSCPSGYAVQNLTTGQPECTPIMVTELDPIFIAQNESIWTAIWDRLLITDQRYNDTALIYQIESNLYTSIDNFNATLQQELLDRQNADNQIYSTIYFVNDTLYQEIYDRQNADSTLFSQISSVNASLLQEIQDRVSSDNSLNESKAGIGTCPTGYVVQNLTATMPECVPLIDLENDPVFLANNQSIWEGITSKLDITDQRYNDTALIYQVENGLLMQIGDLSVMIDNINSTLQQEIIDRVDAVYSINMTKSGIGGCPAGYVVQNLTTDSPECVAYIDYETDPIFTAENSSIWNAINSKLDQTDQRYNETALIVSVNNTLYISIGNLGLEIQNVNASLQQEILERMGADNSLNMSITYLDTVLSDETQARIQNDSYLMSLIPTVQGDGVYTYNTSVGNMVTIHFNDTKLNQTIEQLTGIFEENVTISVSGGVGSGQTTSCCSGSTEILEIAVYPTTITNNYKFYSNTSVTGEVIDQDRATHVGNWVISHAGVVVYDENLNVYIRNALIDEPFRVRIRWRN
jgi:hypothetical protein